VTMLSWNTTHRLMKDPRANPLLIGLIIEELENAIEELQNKRETTPLSLEDESLMRGYVTKRHLLVKKLRDRFRVKDFDVQQTTPPPTRRLTSRTTR